MQRLDPASALDQDTERYSMKCSATLRTQDHVQAGFIKRSKTKRHDICRESSCNSVAYLAAEKAERDLGQLESSITRSSFQKPDELATALNRLFEISAN